MKICYVLNSGDPGGVEQHVLDLTRGMVDRGHEVFVVCPWGDVAKKYFEAGAKVRVDKPALDIDPFYILRLAHFLKKVKPDIFHVHMLKTTGNGLIAASFLKDLPKICHIHTPLPEWQIPWWKKKLDILFNRIVTNFLADAVIALTESRKRVKVEGEGISSEKIRVIPNGVDVGNIKLSFDQAQDGQISNDKSKHRQKLGISEDAVLVGTLSRLTVEKGLEYLTAALSKLSSDQIQDTKYQILIGGSGKLKEKLERQVKDLSIDDKIRFLGFIPEDEKWEYLDALDIFVFPSIAEGFGISLIEAMAAGCACLASDLEVLWEVGGGAVEFFKVGDPGDLAEKLGDLIKNKERREKLGRRAGKRVEKEFSLKKFWDNYEDLYKELS